MHQWNPLELIKQREGSEWSLPGWPVQLCCPRLGSAAACTSQSVVPACWSQSVRWSSVPRPRRMCEPAAAAGHRWLCWWSLGSHRWMASLHRSAPKYDHVSMLIWLNSTARQRKPILELNLSYGIHSVTCHPTQVNVHYQNTDRPVLNSPIPKGWKAELVLVIYRDGLAIRRQSPIQVLSTW